MLIDEGPASACGDYFAGIDDELLARFAQRLAEGALRQLVLDACGPTGDPGADEAYSFLIGPEGGALLERAGWPGHLRLLPRDKLRGARDTVRIARPRSREKPDDWVW